jgi:hypothetical protein
MEEEGICYHEEESSLINWSQHYHEEESPPPSIGLSNMKKKMVKVNWWPILMGTTWRMRGPTIMSKLSH